MYKLILFSFYLLLQTLPLHAQSPDTLWQRPLGTALNAINLTPADITYRPDYEAIDPFRLSWVTYLMQRPLEVPEKAEAFCARLSDSATLQAKLEAALDIVTFGNKNPNYFWHISDSLQSPQAAHVPPPKLKNCPAKIGECLRNNWDLIASAHENAGAMTDSLTREERKLITDSLPLFITSQSDDTELPPDSVKKAEAEGELYAFKMMTAVSKVDAGRLAAAGLYACYAADAIVAQLATMDSSAWAQAKQRKWTSSAEGDVLYAEQTPDGEIIVGGPGRTVYNKPALLIIDVGGDDEYRYAGGATPQQPVSICIDRDGNDTYLSNDDFSFGAGFIGVGILIDCKGDDRYLGANFSQGAGLLGIGILQDRDGDDSYSGQIACQAAGLWGLGLLDDRGGNDSYTARLYSQGFGYCAGLGALLEGGGNDVYSAGGGTKDVNRYQDHFLSMSQGFAIGSRPDCSGGIGLIHDVSGNDIYISDIFGQGCAYWYSLGAIIDEAGDDRYLSYQYSQGAGVHLALGALVDNAGTDYYSAKGVAQGCGHDLAAGFLIDRAGDDSYQSYDLSQGAGSANGAGILVDCAGDDTYAVHALWNTQGYGNPRREFGSIGALLDLAGRDNFIGPGKPEKFWTSGLWGIGWDRDTCVNYKFEILNYELPPISIYQSATPKLSPPRPAEPEPRDSIERLVDHLYNQCSTGENSYDSLVRPSIDSLAAMKDTCVPRLLEKLTTKSATCRQRLEDIFKKIGAPAVPHLVGYLDRGEPRGTNQALDFLGWIGSPDALPALSRFASHGNWKYRATAVNAIGRLKLDGGQKHEAQQVLINALLTDTNNKRVAAWGLGQIGDSLAAPCLARVLDDRYYGVRYNAQGSLIRLGKVCVPALKKRLSTKHPSIEQRIARSLAVGALVKIDFRGHELLKYLDNEDWMVRLSLVSSLDSLAGPEMKKALQGRIVREKNPLIVQRLKEAIEKPMAKKQIIRKPRPAPVKQKKYNAELQ